MRVIENPKYTGYAIVACIVCVVAIIMPAYTLQLYISENIIQVEMIIISLLSYVLLYCIIYVISSYSLDLYKIRKVSKNKIQKVTHDLSDNSIVLETRKCKVVLHVVNKVYNANVGTPTLDLVKHTLFLPMSMNIDLKGEIRLEEL